MQKKLTLFGMLLLISLLAACAGGATTEPPPPIETSPPTVEPTQAAPTKTAAMADVQTVELAEIQNTNWEWISLMETDPAAQTVVPEPGRYTLVFQEDGTYDVVADCNRTSGIYTLEGSDLGLLPGPTTLAECGPESLYNQYLSLLGSVESFGLKDGALVLVLAEGAGEMSFQNGGPAEAAEQTPQPVICAGIEMGSLEFDPMDLPYTWQASCLPASPYDSSQPPGPLGLPEHVQINFGVVNPEQDVQPNDPILYIIPVAEYKNLWDAAGDSTVTNAIDQLQTLMIDQPEAFPTSGVPVLPFEEAEGANDLAVQGQYFLITMGSGARFVGRFSQGPNPVTNDNPQLFYIYEGFTEDGQYLITFFYPVSTTALPNSDGVSTEELQQVESDPQVYLQAKAAELNVLAPSDWEPELGLLDQVISSLVFEYPIPQVSPDSGIVDILWMWSALFENAPANQEVIPDPQSYTLSFFQDGSLAIRADCNSGGGSYTLGGNNMTISIGTLTRVACAEGSQSDQFLDLLLQVNAYALEEEQLVLYLAEEAGKMQFVNGGFLVEIPSVSPDKATATAIEPINVRSGPGTDYASYGVVPIGTTLEVVGVSEDSQWWVVVVPASYNPEGRGWVSASYVEVTNADDIPIVETPPLS